MNDSKEYLDKKAFFDSVITLYGRNVAVEVLEDRSIEIHKVHLSDSNRVDGVIEKITQLAEQRNIEIKMHNKASLSRISKNAKQDQGVAIDIVADNYKNVESLIEDFPSTCKVLALDSIQNPQNLGMILRSAAAGNIDAILLSSKSSAKLSPLVMKASAGTMFKIDIYHTKSLVKSLESLKEKGANVYALSLDARENLNTLHVSKQSVFILGNESEGLSKEVEATATKRVKIDMNRGVESLNVAVTAALISFM